MATHDENSQYESILAQLKSEMNNLRREVQQLTQATATSAEEALQLSQVAKSGEWGPEMQQAAELVANGIETWDSLFSGRSTNSALLKSAMQPNAAKYGGELSAKIKADPVPHVVD
ncbi:hypothetical protein ACFV24_02605 [Nocardia fluminea]|uniref:hypothetical protein n=1 Tax=Nocardia fluminea TaxID=134984 RepID=UPI00366EA552